LDALTYFSPNYRTARARFCEAAHRLGLSVESQVIAATGPQGEPLVIDMTTLGPARSRRVLILSSGLHGVEGFFGSAVQLGWLSTLGSPTDLPESVKVVLIHALNPFGMAWERRWNENNVDLNRNFWTDRSFLSGRDYRESLAVYDRLFSFLNPARPPSRWEPYTLKAICQILAEGWAARRRLPPIERPSMVAFKAIKALGLAELQKTLPVGQYQHENGLFYGGSKTEETTALLQNKLPAQVEGADLALHIDFHTGLGQWADYKLLIVDPKGSPRARWVAKHFGDEVVEAWDGRTAYNANGTLAGYFRDSIPGVTYHCLTAEFGTYKGSRVLGSLRAENQAHYHAKPDSSVYKWAKRQVVEAFVPAAHQWRSTAIGKALEIIRQGISICDEASTLALTGRAEPCHAPEWR